MTYSVDYRRRVIAFVGEGGGKREAARLFKVSPDTLYKWLNRKDDLTPRPARVRHRKLDKAALQRDVKERPDVFLWERAAAFGVHESSVSRALHRLRIVKKTA